MALEATANIEQQQALRLIEQQFDVRQRDENELSRAQLKPVVVRGEAGTGKSWLLMVAATRAHDAQLRVLVVTYTAVLADRYRCSLPFATVDTVHGALRLGVPGSNDQPRLLTFDLVIVDEAMLLPRSVFEALMTAWDLVDRYPVLLLAGDEGQLQPWGNGETCAPTTSSVWWRMAHEVKLWRPMRADDSYWPMLQHIRLQRPTATLRRELIHDRVWTSSVAAFLTRFPGGLVVCISLRAATDINDQTQAELFPGRALRRCWLEEEGGRKLVQLHRQLRVMITQNLDKRNSVVNGRFGAVEAVHTHTIEVVLPQGHVLIRRVHGDRPLPVFPLMRAYACTLTKVQGLTLPAILIVPDVNGIPGAAYMALARVRELGHAWWLRQPRPNFFVPSVAAHQW